MKIIQQLKITSACALLCLSPMLFGCSPKVESGGYVRESGMKDKIIAGQTSKQEVLQLMGSPSSQSSFGQETWYYITDRQEAYAFFKPSVVEQDVLRVEFDSAGLVETVETFDKDDAKKFASVRRATATEGHTLGFFEQLLGNIGRFNRSESSAAPGRKPGRF